MKTSPMSQQVEALKRSAGRNYFALFMEQGTGKAQPLHSRVLTPAGWVPISDLRVGAKVFAADGSVTRITGVFPQGEREIFKVSFHDGTSALCCDDHLWMVSSQARRMQVLKGKLASPFAVEPLKAFRTKLQDGAGTHTRSIPLCGELQFPKRAVTIPAYTVGILLGDGCLRNCCAFTNENDQIVQAVKAELHDASLLGSKDNNHVVRGPTYKNELERLGLLGKYSYEKFVPEQYKHNDVATRLAVLQGLLDTDGGVENGCAIYSSTSEQLANDVAEIVRSFGGIARVKRRTNCGYTKGGERTKTRDGFIVRINLPSDITPFRLQRKLAAYRPHTAYRPKHKIIKTVEPVGSEPCACISIEHESKLYITDGHAVTHNTWVLLAEAERLYAAGKIDGLFVIAPKGVHTNWVLREIPEHLSVTHVAAAWRSGAGVREMRKLREKLLTPREHGEVPPLRILAMNIEALATKEGLDFARRFLNVTRAMAVVDESDLIKNPDAIRTKKVMSLRPLVEYARIATGTPITNSPLDAFSQMEFLDSGLLGTTSYRAFAAEYAQLLDIKAATSLTAENPDWRLRQMVKRNPKVVHAMIIERDESGAPIWRNLDKLQQKLAPHSYRVLKRDCLDLPDKIYQTVFFELTSAQRRAYDLLEDELRIRLEDGSMSIVHELAARIKLQQVTSGFVILPGTDKAVLPIEGGEDPRLEALMTAVERVQGKIIVWAHFTEELKRIAAALRAKGRRVVEYHGGINTANREAAVDALQKGDAEFFLGQPMAGGVGLTLTAAETTVYYSNSWNLRTRLQSEDRNHRIGTKNNVVYIDIAAQDTIDQPITRALQRKERIAAAVLGDRGLKFSAVDAPVEELPTVAEAGPAAAGAVEWWEPPA